MFHRADARREVDLLPVLEAILKKIA